MRRLLALIAPVAFLGVLAGAQGQPAKTFDIYVIDVEGGEATLFVSPTGESLLVDSGWPGFDGRDADRILAVAQQAGVKQIDHFVVTHYHADHVGGAAQLAARLPIRHFIDRGPNASEDEKAAYDAYAPVRAGGRRTEVKPGDSIAVGGLDVRVIAAGGAVLTTPLAAQGAANPFCADFKPQGTEITSRAADGGDSRSVSLFLTYGRFRTAIMGDLTWNKEFELMCPRNPLGNVDVYLVSHHGSDTSGSPALVHALRPRAAIMNNGPRKGGAVQTFEILNRLSNTVDLWQNHYSVPGGQQHNRPETFIANLDEGTPLPGGRAGAAPVHIGSAHWIKVSARTDGSFTIINSRTKFTREYPPRPQSAGISAPAPRTPWGHPDLQGVWNVASGTPLERPEKYAGREFLTNEELRQAEKDAEERSDADRRLGSGTLADLRREHNEFWFDKRSTIMTRRTSLITDPSDGKLPALTPEAAQMKGEPANNELRGTDGPEDRALGERCILGQGGPPILALPGGINEQLIGHKWFFQIVQSVNYVTIVSEYIVTTRIIPLDGRAHLPASVRPWNGDSRGHWDGSTLVVETTNFSPKRMFMGLSAEHLRIVERFTRTGDTLDYQFTMDDPTRWTRPWTAVAPIEKSDFPLYEFACHEGNYGLKNILTVARGLEKIEAEKK